MLPQGGVIALRHKELAAVPVGTRNTSTSRSKISLSLRSTRAVNSSPPYGLACPTLLAAMASITSGDAPAMLSLVKPRAGALATCDRLLLSIVLSSTRREEHFPPD